MEKCDEGKVHNDIFKKGAKIKITEVNETKYYDTSHGSSVL
jgi:hypothetical protein